VKQHRDPSSTPAPAAVVPARVFARPAVLMELLIGLSPLAGVALWGWDVVPVLMLHLLALSVSAAFLILRTAVLSDGDLDYFSPRKDDEAAVARRRRRAARWWLPGFLSFALGFPLLILIAMIVERFGGGAGPVGSVADFWRVVVVGTGLWLPLTAVCLWEAGSFIADAVLPRVRLGTTFRAPPRPVGTAYGALSAELQAYLYVRAWVVLRMVLTALGVGIGMIFSQAFGVLTLIVLLVFLKTSVAVALEAFAIADEEKRRTGGSGDRTSEARASSH
jgi:hypothetical protein